MKRARSVLLALLAAVTCALVIDQRGLIAAERLQIRTIKSPSGRRSAQPRLLAVDDGVAMSWLERQERGHRLRWSRWSGGRWSQPVTIDAGDSFFVNWADFPSIRSLGEKRWAAHWLWKNGRGTYAYDVRMSFSDDDGRTWSHPITPHRDGTTTEHGFVSLLRENDAARAFWLDGRNFANHKDAEHSATNMTVRTAVLRPDGIVAEEAELDGRCCECCATAAVTTSRGMLVAYRDRSDDEVRDIGLVRYEDGRWTKPYLLHADGWKIAGCPVNGPALDASGDQVVAAWFTGASDTPRVLVAFSKDRGRRFSNPIRVDGGNPSGRVGTALMPDSSAFVSWLETVNGKAAIRVRRVAPSGPLGIAQTIAASSTARASGFPQLVRTGKDLWFAWTDVGKQSQIRIASVPLAHSR